MATRDADVKELRFNKPQLRFIVAILRHATSNWARGTGKSSIIAWLIIMIVRLMPRSSWAIVGRTYSQMLTRTLPSTVAALARLGYEQNVHYYIGRRPPISSLWLTPYEAPLKYDYYISFPNGTGFHLISQDGGGGNSRGLNLDGVITDEALLIDKGKLDADTLPANRGNRDHFKHVPFHHGVFHFTSMPLADEAQWLLDHGDYYKELGLDYVTLGNELADLQELFIDCRDPEERKAMWPQIKALMQERSFTVDPKTGRLYSEANAFDNIENLGLKYLEEQRDTLPDFVFGIELLGRRATRSGAGFYPALRVTHHSYRASADARLEEFNYDFHRIATAASGCVLDADCDPHLPLRMAVDWGARISVLSVAQQHPREYRFLKDFFVLHPKLIRDLAQLVTDYYANHLTRRIDFIEDAEWGNAIKPDSTQTYNDQFVDLLTTAGWRVNRVSLGRAPSHSARYQIATELLSEKDHGLPIIRFNREKCADLLLAMSMAPVRIDKGVIQKDKRSEARKTGKLQHATHFTDTFDLHALSIGRSVIQRRPDFGELIMVTG